MKGKFWGGKDCVKRQDEHTFPLLCLTTPWTHGKGIYFSKISSQFRNVENAITAPQCLKEKGCRPMVKDPEESRTQGRQRPAWSRGSCGLSLVAIRLQTLRPTGAKTSVITRGETVQLGGQPCSASILLEVKKVIQTRQASASPRRDQAPSTEERKVEQLELIT